MDFQSIKREMSHAYSRKAGEYGKIRNSAFDAFLKQEIDFFAGSLNSLGRRVLDVGSGPGHESTVMRHQNLSPICIDLSYGMALEGARKDLDTCVADFYHLCFPDQTFAGIWMAFSLLHVPKSDVITILQDIHRILMPKGIFYVSLFEGQGEGQRDEDLGKYGCRRYFSYYSQEELAALVAENFLVVRTARLNISPRPTISVQCIKN